MAPSDQIRLRAAFLNDASHLLAVSSPAAAALLGSTRDRLVEAAEVELTTRELDHFRREICRACGSPLIPGWSCKVTTDYGRKETISKRKAKLQRENSGKPEKVIIYSCLRCHRETAHAVQKRVVKIPKKLELQVDERVVLDAKLPTGIDQKVQKTVNASSKQRQKARKGGLQAMLERNKVQTSDSVGLDFMDFAL